MSVTLRKRKLEGGKTSLYLDIYHNGKRHHEFLNLYLFKDGSGILDNQGAYRGGRAVRI